nr:hypothetical protein [Propioniciclava coleopterorum]
MQNPFEGKRIWFLTGSQDLYGPETLDQVAAQAAEVVAQLNAGGEIPVEVVGRPTLKDRDAIRAEMLAANADDAVVGVITWMHTFSPAKMWLLGLDALAKPLLHLHTQASAALPWATLDMDYMNLNQSAHGDREFAYAATRLGKARRTVVGHAGQDATRAKIGDWARAATAWDDLHHLSVARFGDNMRNVAVTEGDKTEAELTLGVAINTWGVNDLVAAVAAVAEADIDALVAEYERLYDVAPSCARAGTGTRRCARAHARRSGCGTSWRRAASGRSPPTSRTSAA